MALAVVARRMMNMQFPELLGTYSLAALQAVAKVISDAVDVEEVWQRSAAHELPQLTVACHLFSKSHRNDFMRTYACVFNAIFAEGVSVTLSTVEEARRLGKAMSKKKDARRGPALIGRFQIPGLSRNGSCRTP